MLVLSRKKNEKIIVGRNITITVVDIQNGRVRLGIDAPKDVPVLRNELINWKNDGGTTIDEEKRQAKKSAETIDINLENIGEDTVDTDSLSGFVLPKDVAAAVQQPPVDDEESSSGFVLDHEISAIIKAANEGSKVSKTQSAPKTS